MATAEVIEVDPILSAEQRQLVLEGPLWKELRVFTFKGLQLATGSQLAFDMLAFVFSCADEFDACREFDIAA